MNTYIFLTSLMMILLLISGMIFHLYLYRNGALYSLKQSAEEERIILDQAILETIPNRR